MSLSAPGVDIEYPTGGPPTVRELSTSVTAFVGRTVLRPPSSPSGVFRERITSANEYLQKYGTPGASHGAVSLAGQAADTPTTDFMGHAISGFFRNGGVEAEIVSTSSGTGERATGTFEITAGGNAVVIRAEAASRGAWGNQIDITLTRATADRVDVTISSAVTAGGQTGTRTERFTSVRPTVADFAALASQYVTFVAGDAAGLPAAPPEGHRINLADAGSVQVDLSNGANAGNPSGTAITDAIAQLQDADDVSLITLPGRSWSPGGADNAVFQQFVSHSEQMADRMVLVQLAHSVEDFSNTGLPLSSYLSAYYPEGIVSIPLTRDVVARQQVGLSGHVAGVVARTDQAVGAWQSAAGLKADIRGITELSRTINRVRQVPINAQGINAMRVVNGIAVIYGARTCDVGGIYEYMAVRRLAFLIGDSLRAALQRVVFARNIPSTHQSVKTAATGFLQSLFDRQAFSGTTADEAFEVRCGLGESMTEADLRNGLMVLVVRVWSAFPAERIIVRVEQRLSGES